MVHLIKEKKKIRRRLHRIQGAAISGGLDLGLLHQLNYICNYKAQATSSKRHQKLVISVVTAFILLVLVGILVENILSARCLLPSNYLVWEATRPLANCNYCVNITKPIILENVSRTDFIPYAYSSKPIIVKKGISHWRAMKEFTYYTFKRLYERTIGSYESLEDGCQFLNFKSDLFTLKDVFNMPKARVKNEPGQDPWYVGWGNCHPDILAKVRQYYSIPEFLPGDAEFPATENIFLGYEIGAVMHVNIFYGYFNLLTPKTNVKYETEEKLDYIPRLMWQGQVKGNKTWVIAPVPECEHVCHKFDYYVEPGDVVLLDTRLWYHATSIPKGQFSLTVQSEYG